MSNNYSDIIMNKKDLINEDNIITDDNVENEDEDVYSLFSYDDKIIQAYSFPDGSNTIYRDIGDGTLAILYQHQFDEESGEEFITIYENNGVYAITKSEDYIDNAMYTTTKDFIALLETQLKSKKDVDSVDFEKCVPIVVDSEYVSYDNEIAKKFKAAYTKYTMAENAIPTQVLLHEILSKAQNFIATKKIDMKELLRNFTHLHNFQDFCKSSIECVSPFVNDPSSVDLRQFISDLASKMKNIDNIIGMYLEEELKDDKDIDIDERGI
ncbi:MAG: hypothetical protein IJH34_09970 [Romboutsia sp.]|nr:hypothetical protein [Romboutsia sp.]